MFTVHICNGDRMITHLCPTGGSSNKMCCYNPYHKQVTFNSAPSKAVDPKAVHHGQHELLQGTPTTHTHPRTQTTTLENQVETQEVSTSSAGFQTWRSLLWDNHQQDQPTTKEATATKNVVKSGSVNASDIVVHNPLWSSCTPAVTTNKQVMSHDRKHSIGPNIQRPPSGCTSKPWSATTKGTWRRNTSRGPVLVLCKEFSLKLQDLLR